MNSKFSKYYTYIKPVLKNKAVKTYSSLAFSLVTISIFAIYAIRPTVETIVSLQKSVAEQETILQKLNTKRQNLSEGRKNYQLIEEDIKKKLLSLLPNSTNLPPLVDDLSTVAVINQASISALQFQPFDLQGEPDQIVKNATMGELIFTINVQGSYQQLTALINSLAKTTRLISIQSINFNKPADGALLMSVNAKAIYFKN